MTKHNKPKESKDESKYELSSFSSTSSSSSASFSKTPSFPKFNFMVPLLVCFSIVAVSEYAQAHS